MARSKGTGSLVKRGKYWQCKVVVDGKPHYKATGTASKVEAKKILDDFVRPFLAGSDVERLEAVETRIRMKETEAAEAKALLNEAFDMLQGIASEHGYEGLVRYGDPSVITRLADYLGKEA